MASDDRSFVALLDADTTEGCQSPVLHLFPNSAAHAAHARALSPLLIAVAGVTLKLTAQQVRCVTFPEPLPGCKIAYVPGQGNVFVVFCWALNTPDTAAFKLAQVVTQLLFGVLGPVTGWTAPSRSQEEAGGNTTKNDLIESSLLPSAQHQFNTLIQSMLQQLSVSGWQSVAAPLLLPAGVPASSISEQTQPKLEAVLSQLEADAAALQSAAFVGQPQACLLHRGAVAGSHMQPHITHSVWAFCWGISVLQRTTAHPPIAMLQDLQVPDQADSARARADLPASMDGTVCMTLLLVACAESLLCLAFWPRPQTSGEDMAASPVLEAATSCLHTILTTSGALSSLGTPYSSQQHGESQGTQAADERKAGAGSTQPGRKSSCVYKPGTGKFTLLPHRQGEQQEFYNAACWIHDCLTRLRQLTSLSSEAYTKSPVSSLDPGVFASDGALDYREQNDAEQADKLFIRIRAPQQHAAAASSELIKGCLDNSAGFKCALEESDEFL